MIDWMCLLVIFLCKQKTAYKMRISDWSSDVCSSDLLGTTRLHRAEFLRATLMEDADAVDHIIGAGDRLLHRQGHADIGLHDVDLADIAHRLEEQGRKLGV